MSFSSKIKNELCRMDNLKKCCYYAELLAAFRANIDYEKLEKKNSEIRLITENASFARRTFLNIKHVYNILPEIIIRRNPRLKKNLLYIIIINSEDILGSLDLLKYSENIKKMCCKKSYLRGLFLATGSISDPEKTYHLEFNCKEYKLAEEIVESLNKFKLSSKIITRKGNYVVYLKDGEKIAVFLNLTGAHKSLMEYENIRIIKDVKNNVNRIVNCETANIGKTADAAVRQINSINYIKENIGFENLPENLRLIAELRLKFTEYNLKELGELLNPVLGKSGVNHRLNKLDKIAENYKNLKGEF